MRHKRTKRNTHYVHGHNKKRNYRYGYTTGRGGGTVAHESIRTLAHIL